MRLHRAPLSMECICCVWHHCHIDTFELLVPGAFLLYSTTVNKHIHSSFTSVVSMDSLQVGSRVETRTLSVRPEALTGYPSDRSPNIGVHIGLDDANLTCIVGTFHAEFLLFETHFPHFGVQSAGLAPLPPRFRTFLDETVKTIALFPSC